MSFEALAVNYYDYTLLLNDEEFAEAEIWMEDGRVSLLSVKEVEDDNIAEKFNVPVNDIKRRAGPIDVLIGINYPKFHAQNTKIRDGFVARKSPLGWVIFGVNKSTTYGIKQVLHVRVAASIDVTDFWETESMGASAI